jgi:hypothetical protein
MTDEFKKILKAGGDKVCPLHDQTFQLVDAQINQKLTEKELKTVERINACILEAGENLQKCISSAKCDFNMEIENVRKEAENYIDKNTKPVWDKIYHFEDKLDEVEKTVEGYSDKNRKANAERIDKLEIDWGSVKKDVDAMKLKMAKWAGAFVVLIFLGQIIGGVIISVVLKSTIEQLHTQSVGADMTHVVPSYKRQSFTIPPLHNNFKFEAKQDKEVDCWTESGFDDNIALAGVLCN